MPHPSKKTVYGAHVPPPLRDLLLSSLLSVKYAWGHKVCATEDLLIHAVITRHTHALTCVLPFYYGIHCMTVVLAVFSLRPL